ncbi:MAG: DUF4336 domain-containing protein [Gemmatimonadetes bacterium]|nr:DUF4336 domain-containing protein [Gemmatimonadota bacterium]
MEPLRELHSGQLWVAEQPLRVGLFELGRRMTVVRLADGSLFLHSVAGLTQPLRAAIDLLGPVRFVVSPNKFHHRYMEQYASTYPHAELIASPGLPAKRADLSFGATLGSEPDPRWAAELDQTLFDGSRFVTEVDFHHPSSRTLILTDLCFNIGPDRPLATQVLARALGGYRRLAVTRSLRITLRDPTAARASLARILRWDFDRVIVGHGDIVESGGKAAFRQAFAWLEPTPLEPARG